MNQEEFIQALKEKNIILTNKQIEQFERYYELLIEWNEKINLTAITNKEEVYLKHFYDSLTIAFNFQMTNQTLCDIGAGAGFPSIPLKIVFPQLKITIIDSLTKRITFLKYLVKELGLDQIEAISVRAEEYALSHREMYDIVTARAVARLNILDELCLPLVKMGGYFITLKGLKANEELIEAKKGIETLGGKVINKEFFTLNDSNDHRCNIYIIKEKETPKKYPRAFGKMKKNPL